MRYNFGMNWGLIGHEWAVQMLKKQINSGGIRQAYLITGPKGIGRRTLALKFVQALNCRDIDPDGEPCFKCRTCDLIGREKHSDVAVVRTEAGGRILKVDQIRELGRFLSLTPYETRFKIALLINFEEANDSASNAFLKTLEEPPEKSIIIITAETPESLLPTIISRCEVIMLRPLAADSLYEQLQRVSGRSDVDFKLLAHLSDGCPGVALNMMNDPDLVAVRKNWLDEHIRLLAVDRIDRFTFADGLSNKTAPVSEILATWLSLWRDVLLRSSGSQVPLSNIDRIDEIVSISNQFDIDTARNMVAVIQNTIDLLLKNINPKLAIENLMLNLPRIASE